MANRYFINGGVNNLWGDTSNWSTTDGGAGGASVPTVADDVFFTSLSPNCTVSTSNRVCKTINYTGYTNTITLTTSVAISGDITLSPTMTVAGAGNHNMNATGTLTSNGKVWNALFNFTGSGTFTLADDFYVTGTLTIAATGTLTGNTIYVGGNLVLSSTLTGYSTNLVLNGNSTISGAGTFRNNLTINTAGTVTFPTTFAYNAGIFTYTAGTVVPPTTLQIGASTTLNTAGINWNNISVSGAATTITNNSLLTVNGTLAYLSGSVVTFTGTHGWTANTFDIQTANSINHTLKAGLTYTVTNSFISNTTTNAAKDTLKSDSAGVQAIFTLNYGASQSVAYTNATDIDSSQGQTIYSANGTLSNATNWNTLTANDMSNNTFIFIN